ncbi:MAG: c-type cytochrome [Polyangiaceae bacterium]
MKWLRRIAIGLGVSLVVSGAAAAVFELRAPNMRPIDATKKIVPTAGRIARGRYIVNAEAHCMHCHSERDWSTHGAPEVPGLSGAGWDVPFAENHMPGRVFAPNITPDVETGIGAVPDDAIARAIREGVSSDGRPLFMMPWQNFRHFSDEDVASIIAYLRSRPPVAKKREVTSIDRPVSWILKTQPKPLLDAAARPDPSNPIERGRYLAEVGQCESCHTPVDDRHQPLAGMAFAGGQEFVIRGVTYRSSNITPHVSGISYYDEALFIRTMRTGNVGGRRLAPIMPWSAIRELSDDDLKALWAYLQTVKPVAHEVTRAEVELADNPAIAEHP